MSTTLTRPTESQMRGFTRDGVVALSGAKGEPEWVLEARLRSWEVYEATPMPTARDEEWRRTSIRQLKLDQVRPFDAGSPPQETLAALPGEVRAGLSEEGRAGLLVQHNSGTVFHMIGAEASMRRSASTPTSSAPSS